MKKINLARPTFCEVTIEKVAQVLRSGQLVQGERVREFEKTICDYTNSRHAVAVNSATTGLYASLIAAGITQGDEVIVPAFSYIATANVVEMLGATPIFCDISSVGFNIDLTKLDDCLTKKTKALIAVHEFGEPLDMQFLQEFCSANRLLLIEDAACALGTRFNGQHVGHFGFAGVFSFHPRKSITCGDGGVIVTNSDEAAAKLRALRNHGLESYGGVNAGFSKIGLNFRLTEVQAVLLNAQMDFVDEFINKKISNVKAYDENLSNEFLKPDVNHQGHSWQSYHLVCQSQYQRDYLISMLSEFGIFVSIGAQCIPAEPFYLNKYNLTLENYQHAMKANTAGFVLPIHENLDAKDIACVIQKLNEGMKNVEK